MESTREIYWNVGSGVILPMYILAALGVGVLAFGLFQRIKVYKLGKPLDRVDELPSRTVNFLKNTFLQLKVLRSKPVGLGHAIFFWSFITLFIGTTLVFIETDITYPLFGWRFLTGGFYEMFSFTLDIAGFAAMLAMGGLFIRRYIFRPEGLQTSADDAIIHGLLFAILFTGFTLEGLRMAVTELGSNMALAHYSPVGLVFAKAFSVMEEAALKQAHLITWWVHLLLVITFFIAIPFTKLRHMFTTPANYIFSDRRRKGSVLTLDLEDEAVETFGVTSVAEFHWKDIFDSDACTLCKRCQDVCPAYTTGKPLSPMKVINQIGETAFGDSKQELIELIGKDALWACTTCRACQEVCPASIEHVNKIVDMRRSIALMEGDFPGEEVKAAMDGVEVNGNPLGMAFATRGDWAQDLPLTATATDADILYFPGCYASFDNRNIAVAKSFIKLCASAGVSVAILGKEEKCCGEPVRKLGNEYLYQEMAKENIEKINALGVKQVVTTCPHCFNTLDRDYRDLGLTTRVMHHTTFLAGLMDEGKLKVNETEFNATYHDSCYIGRYNDIYDQPRKLITQAGGQIAEMEKKRDGSFCCGAGGGRIVAEESLGVPISSHRVKMAQRAGGELLISNCPFCLTMFEDAVKTVGVDKSLQPKDIAEILAERL